MNSLAFTFLAISYATLVSGTLLPVGGGIPIITDSGSGSGSGSGGPTFQLHQNVVGKDFFTAFKWETFNDPTHGRVNYIDQATAMARNLTYVSDNKFIMRPDYQNVVPSNARGRDSNRISSYSTYQDSVVVLDVQHVPDSICSVWPAFWTVTASGNWAYGGEIDIYEGVNKNEANLGSLHTSPGCTMPQNRAQTGRTISTNCNAYENNNQGCGTQFTKPASFGNALNSIGGGWFVMERTRDSINMWFWGRNDPSIPLSVARGNTEVTPDASWGTPDASFPSTSSCNINSHFDAHMVVFDTTFCGDWAGGQYGSSGCPGSCEDFVNNNPAAFTSAYWEINALRIYTPQGSLL